MREVQVVIEPCGDPDFAYLDASMIGWIVLGVIWFLSIFEIELEVFEKGGLVGFHREAVMRFSFFDQIAGEVALSQECICGNGFASDLDGVKQGCRRLDLVRAL